MKKYSSLLLGFTFLTGLIQNLYGQQATIPKSKNDFAVIAHRGNHTNAPENTLIAYLNAITAGADYIETDLRTTKDSQLVIMHDASVNRMTNGNGKIGV